MIKIFANYEGKITEIPNEAGILGTDGKWYYIEWEAEDKKLYAFEVKDNIIQFSTQQQLKAGDEFEIKAPIKLDTSAWQWSKTTSTTSQAAAIGDSSKKAHELIGDTKFDDDAELMKEFEARKAKMLASRNKVVTKTTSPTNNQIDVLSKDFDLDKALEKSIEKLTVAAFDDVPKKKISTKVEKEEAAVNTSQSQNDVEKAIALLQSKGININSQQNQQNFQNQQQQPSVQIQQFATPQNNQPIQQPQIQYVQPVQLPIQQVPMGNWAQYCNQMQQPPFVQQQPIVQQQPVVVQNPQVQIQPVSNVGNFANLQAIQQLDQNFVFENATLLLMLQTLPPDKRSSILKLMTTLLNGGGNVTLALL